MNKTFQLIYKATTDGVSAQSFHTKCDGVLGTFFVIKANNSNIFGGYTYADWSGYAYDYDPSAFLYSLVNQYNVSVKMNIMNPQYAIYSSPYYGVVFGSGFEFYCSDNLNCNSYGLGNTYQLPSFLTQYSMQAQSFLGGNSAFQATDIEVYSIYIDRKFYLYLSFVILNLIFILLSLL